MSSSNLYTCDLDKLTLDHVKSFLALAEAEEDRPREGVRLDFKQEPNMNPNGDRIGDMVAALANTMGGLVIVGVGERKGLPVDLPGVLRKGELKSRLNSMIHRTVYPVPDYRIGVVAVSATHDVAVIRVEEGGFPPYMWTENRANKVSVRVEDQCLPADPQQLEALYARRTLGGFEGGLRRLPSPQEIFLSEHEFFERFPPENDDNYHRICISTPRSPADIRLDMKVQREVTDTLSKCLRWDTNFETIKRDRLTLDVQRSPQISNFTRFWRFTSSAGLGFSTSLVHPTEKTASLDDMVWDIIFTIRAGRALLDRFQRYGEVQIGSYVHLSGVRIVSPRSLRGIAGLPEDVGQVYGGAWCHLDFSELEDPSAGVAGIVMDHLHNNKRGDVDFEVLVASIREMVCAADAPSPEGIVRAYEFAGNAGPA